MKTATNFKASKARVSHSWSIGGVIVGDYFFLQRETNSKKSAIYLFNLDFFKNMKTATNFKASKARVSHSWSIG